MTNQHEPLTEQEFVKLFEQADPETQNDVMKLLNGEMSIEEAEAKYKYKLQGQQGDF